jgi:uroporphyrin-3 C-methyltransferase
VTEDSNKVDPKESAAAAKVDNKAAVKNTKSAAKKTNIGKPLWPKFLLALILIIAVTAIGWLGWVEWQQRLADAEDFNARLANLDKSYIAIEHQSQLAEKRASQRSDQMLQVLTKIQLRLNNQGKRLAELGSTTRSDWLLAEASYLARLANQRLQTERSTKSPLALLQNVDVILKQLDDPELLPVRRVVAADITALQLAGEVDSAGLYLELSALAEAVVKLSVLKPVTETMPEPKQTENAIDEQPKLRGMVTGFMASVSKLIRVSQRSQPIEPLLQVHEEAIVRQNLRLMLEQAQSAVMREEQAIYSQSLEKAQRWLAQYFQLNPSATVIQQRLANLSDIEVIQQLPNISDSLQAIETLAALRSSRLTTAEDAVIRE